MYKSKLWLLVIFVALLSGCDKDSTTVVDTGTIRYSNMSSGGNRYEIFLDGASLGLLDASAFYDKPEVPVGSHIVKAVQHEGYVLFPTVKESTVIISKGITLEFSFP